MVNVDQFKRTYFEECSELISELEDQFQNLENGRGDSGSMDAVFRAVHSIKGGAGAFGFSELVDFTHSFETLLDLARSGHIVISDDVLAVCLKAVDTTADLIAAAQSGDTSGITGYSDLKTAIYALCREDKPAADQKQSTASTQPASKGKKKPTVWTVVFAPKPILFERGNDPLLLFRALNLLAEIHPVATITDLPALSELDAMAPYIGWQITLPSHVERDEIEEVFDFVEGECFLQIVETVQEEKQAEDKATEKDKQSQTNDEGGGPETIAAGEPSEQDQQASVPSEPVITIPSGDGAAQAPIQTVRVDLEKVDRVVDMVGEIAITQSMLAAQMDESLREEHPELVRGLEIMAQHARDLQDSVMALRAQPIQSIFARMKRIVRDLSERTSKPLKLEITGEATEIDKTIVEKLSEPLTHMIRNAADHGIEDPATRKARAKPEVGTIWLDAHQRNGRIFITIGDDGGGINRQKVLERARQAGLVSANGNLSDQQIDSLIFEPGFSTVDGITNLSGRGVGLDVVVENIRQVGGAVAIRSVPESGTEVTLSLPLTLAIMDVMLVESGASSYVIPLSNIIESTQYSLSQFGVLPSGERMLRVMGAYVRVIDLCQVLGQPCVADDKSRFVILCETHSGERVALLVDAIQGQQQVVIKSIEQNFGQLNGISGATILGNGEVALILDIAGIIELDGVMHRAIA